MPSFHADAKMDLALPKLNMLSEKMLPQGIKPGSVAYCPSMDLIALVTCDEQGHVFRFNGQRVFGVASKRKGSNITQLRWKPNGRILAVAYSDNSVSLINSHTGKIVHSIDCSKYSRSCISSLGWGINFTDVQSTKARVHNLHGEATLDDVVHRGFQSLGGDLSVDLPVDLAFLDIEGVLPKLSTLPPSSKDEEVFSSRASLDAVFHNSKKDLIDSADALLIGFEDGALHLSIYDFFEIGSFDMNKSYDHTGLGVILHASHPYFSTHGLLLSTSPLEPEKGKCYFAPLDLRLIPDTGRYLSLLASKSTQLQNVLRYLRESQIQMYKEFNSSQDLAHKFIRNIEETLQEKDQCSFVNAAYHLVATGDCYPAVKEWLVDELGERGQKRWEKATASGYENLKRLIHENLLPALDRFAIIISRLRGLAKFQEHTTAFGLSLLELDHILETLRCVQLLAHTALIHAGSELREFTAFSAWMRQEIENQAADPLSLNNEDADKDAMLDYPKIFAYVQGAMLHSRLYSLFDLHGQDQKPAWDFGDDASSIYFAYRKELKASQPGVVPHKRLPGLNTLIARLENQCRGVFNSVAETQQRKVRFGNIIALSSRPTKYSDIRMIIKDGVHDQELCDAYIAIVTNDNSSVVSLYKISLLVRNGISSTASTTAALIYLPDGLELRGVKFVDDETLMIATKDQELSHLVYVRYLEAGSTGTLSFHTWRPGSEPSTEPGLDLRDKSLFKSLIRHTFSSEQSWAPKRLEVNGRKGRRAVCVVAEDGLHYRVFDIDSNTTEADEIDADAEDEGMEDILEDDNEMIT